MLGSINLSLLIWTFTIYSFLGWLTEVTYCSLKRKKFTNRGFLFGPFCPIYGFSFVLVIWLLSPFRNNLILFFLGAIIVTSFVEYFTGVILELLFKTQWWDYSKRAFNLNGKVCLRFSLYWGVLCTLIIKLIHPLILGVAQFLTFKLTDYAASLVLAYFIVDSSLTFVSLYGLKNILESLNNLKRQYDLDVTNVRQNSLFPFLRLRKLQKNFNLNQAQLLKNFKKRYIHFIDAFPELKSSRFPVINDIRKKLGV